jgi:hypothetical protein
MVLTGETGAPGDRPVCPSVTPPTTQPPWADLELNSGLRGERLTFCFYRPTVVPDALCMVQPGNPCKYEQLLPSPQRPYHLLRPPSLPRSSTLATNSNTNST